MEFPLTVNTYQLEVRISQIYAMHGLLNFVVLVSDGFYQQSVWKLTRLWKQTYTWRKGVSEFLDVFSVLGQFNFNSWQPNSQTAENRAKPQTGCKILLKENKKKKHTAEISTETTHWLTKKLPWKVTIFFFLSGFINEIFWFYEYTSKTNVK